MLKISFSTLLALVSYGLFGQLTFSSYSAQTIDFDNTVTGVNNGTFSGSGFTSSPSSGQLDSDGIIAIGTGGGVLTFGGTQTSSFFARGTSDGGVNSGGIYAFDISNGGPQNYALGVQPSSSSFTEGSFVIKLENTTGDGVQYTVDYNLYEYNDGDYSSRIKFSYSFDGTNFTELTNISHETAQNKLNSPNWIQVSKSTVIPVVVINNQDVYIKWTIDDVSGSGKRDEIGIDDIVVTPAHVSNTSIISAGGESASLSSINNSNVITNTTDGEKFWHFVVQDGAGSDADNLPTTITKIVLTKSVNNEVFDWSSSIKKAAVFNGSTRLDVATKYADSLVFNLSGTEGKVIDDGSKQFDFYLSLDEVQTDRQKFGFKIESNGITTDDPSTSSQMALFDSLVSDNTKNAISVVPTALNFISQPVNGIVGFGLNPSIKVEFTDVHGNRDLDAANVASVSINSSGTLTGGAQTLQANSEGVVEFSSLVHSATGTNFVLTATDLNDFMGLGFNTQLTSGLYDIVDASQLIISEVIDPSDNGNAKFVELYNTGSTPVYLSTDNYFLGVQFNGSTVTSYSLSTSDHLDTIPPYGTYIVSSNPTEFQSVYGATAFKNAGVLGNGDDAVFLLKGGAYGTGYIVDILGVIDQNGTGENWEYTDSRMTRNSSVTFGRPIFSVSEWTKTSSATASTGTPYIVNDELRYIGTEWTPSSPSSSTGNNNAVVQYKNWNVTTDYAINQLHVLEGASVSAIGNVTLTLNSNLRNEGEVNFSSNAALHQTNEASVNVGNINYERSGLSSTSRFNVWGTMVQNADIMTVFSSNNPCDIYVFDGSIQQWRYDFPANSGSYTCNGSSGIQFPSNIVISGADGLMDEGRGYFVPGNSIGNYIFTGVPNNGPFNQSIHAVTNPGSVNWSQDNWNLVSNPYPGSIDADASNLNSFINVNGPNGTNAITGELYFWIDDGQSNDYDEEADYATFNNTGGNPANGVTPTRYIPAGRGFWVKANSNSDVKFNNSMRVTGNNSISYKQIGDETARMWIGLKGNGFKKSMLVGLNEQATDQYDMGWDAITPEVERSIRIQGILDTVYTDIYATNFPSKKETKFVSLFVETKQENMHEILLDSLQNWPENVVVLLHDNENGKVYDLKKDIASIWLSKGSYSDRFKLELKEKKSDSGIVSTDEVDKHSIQVLDGEFNWLLQKTPSGFYSLYDLTGKVIQAGTSLKSGFKITKPNQKGIYILSIKNHLNEQIRLKLKN